MPKIQGILETALYVSNLEISQAFYCDLFELETLLSDDRMCALKICDTQILLLFKIGGSTKGEEAPGGFIPPHDGRGQLHLAFSIEPNEISAWRQKLQSKGIPIESEVEANQGHSIYFRDPDGHALELATPGLWNTN